MPDGIQQEQGLGRISGLNMNHTNRFEFLKHANQILRFRFACRMRTCQAVWSCGEVSCGEIAVEFHSPSIGVNVLKHAVRVGGSDKQQCDGIWWRKCFRQLRCGIEQIDAGRVISGNAADNQDVLVSRPESGDFNIALACTLLASRPD